jgi:cell division protease FtsH
MQNASKMVALLLVLGLIGLLLAIPLLGGLPELDRPWSQFLRDVEAGAVTEIAVGRASLIATAQSGETYQVILPPDRAAAVDRLLAHPLKVSYTGEDPARSASILLGLILPVLIFGLFIWLFAHPGEDSAGQAFSFGRSHAQLVQPGEGTVTLRDVAGLPEVKEELAEVIDFLHHPDRYAELGARIPRGVLLSGPPGTGKTLLAKAVAGEAGVPFFSAAGSDFVEIFAGVGAARVRDLFSRARRNAPCVIFLDEIDAIARRRGMGVGGGVEEREQTLNQLLVEMDGFATDCGIIVMAATNRIDTLDPAILRRGRFDRQILVDPPDRKGREEILSVHARAKRIAADADLGRVAAITAGFTGADLANLLNEAALLAARRRQEQIGMAELLQAYERVATGGPQRQAPMGQAERERMAIHEAGHAIVAFHLPGADPVAKISILPRGRHLGYTLYQPGEERHLHTEGRLMDRLAILLGGRAAEELVLGEASTSGADDLTQATAIARRMVTSWGMSPAGPIALGETGGVATADRTARLIDQQVAGRIQAAQERALAMVSRHRGALDRLAAALLARESLEGDEVTAILVG